MKVRRFLRQDLAEINSWREKRNLPLQDIKDLPLNGFIVIGVAAGFIYLTDSNLCLIESIISNPSTSKEDRSEALDLIVESILEMAKRCGYKRIFGLTTLPSVIKRAVNHKFLIGRVYTTLMKEL